MYVILCVLFIREVPHLSEDVFHMDKFEGGEIKVVTGATGRRERFEFFYGGSVFPDGNGHGKSAFVAYSGALKTKLHESDALFAIEEEKFSTAEINDNASLYTPIESVFLHKLMAARTQYLAQQPKQPPRGRSQTMPMYGC